MSSEAGGWPNNGRWFPECLITDKAKQKAGEVTNRTDLASEGQSEKLAGKVQKKVGQIGRIFEK